MNCNKNNLPSFYRIRDHVSQIIEETDRMPGKGKAVGFMKALDEKIKSVGISSIQDWGEVRKASEDVMNGYRKKMGETKYSIWSHIPFTEARKIRQIHDRIQKSSIDGAGYSDYHKSQNIDSFFKPGIEYKSKLWEKITDSAQASHLIGQSQEITTSLQASSLIQETSIPAQASHLIGQSQAQEITAGLQDSSPIQETSIKDLLKPTSEQVLKILQSGDLLVKAEVNRLSLPVKLENHKGYVFNAYKFLPNVRADLKNPGKRAIERIMRTLKRMEDHQGDRLIKRDTENQTQDGVVVRSREYYEEKVKNNSKEISEKTSCTLFPPDCNMELFGDKSDDCTFALCMDLSRCTVRDEKDVYNFDASTSTKSSPSYGSGNTAKFANEDYEPHYKKDVLSAINLKPPISLKELKAMNLKKTEKVKRKYNEVLAAIRREAILGVAVRFSTSSENDSNLKDFELLCALDRVLLLKRELNIIAPLMERTFNSMIPISFEESLKVVEKYLQDLSNIKEKINPEVQPLLEEELKGMKAELLEIIGIG